MNYLLQSSICLGVLYIFYHFVLRGLPSFQWNRIYLLAMCTVSLLLPLLSIEVYPKYITLVTGSTSAATSTPIVDAVASDTISLGLINYAYIIYFTIAGFFLLRLIYNLTSTAIRINRSPKQVKNNYILVEGESDTEVYSFFKYLIKPKGEELQKEVIEHELAHIRQHHSVDLILSEIVKAILWFNPFVYLSQKAIKINHEYICDASASLGVGRYNYALILNKVSYDRSHQVYVNNFSFKLKNRIIMLQKLDNLKEEKWRYTLLIPLMFLGMHLFALETYTVMTPNDNVTVSDTIPQVKPIFQIDTITVFDYNTYKETVKIEKTIIGDTIIVFDKDRFEETVSIVERMSSCYVILIGNRAVAGSMEVKKSELIKLLDNQPIKVTPLKKSCGKVDNWDIRLTLIPGNGADPQMQPLTIKNNKVGSALLKDSKIVSGTKIFLDNIKINENVVIGATVFTVK